MRQNVERTQDQRRAPVADRAGLPFKLNFRDEVGIIQRISRRGRLVPVVVVRRKAAPAMPAEGQR